MNVKIAISLMAQNPAVDFPWEKTLIALINTCLPEGSRLDPLSASAADVQAALDSLEADVREMLYSSNLDAVNVIAPAPATTVTNGQGSNNNLLLIFGAMACSIALVMTFKGMDSAAIVEIVKLLMSLVQPSPA